MPRPRNLDVHQNFKDVLDARKKGSQHQCLHCGHISAKNAQRGQQHLAQCEQYINAQRIKSESSPPTAVLTQLPTTVAVRPLSRLQIAQANRSAAMAVYMGNLPINHYENPYVLAHHRALHPGYKPPNRAALAGGLLKESYNEVKRKVDAQLDVCSYLNFFTDETVNNRKECVINLCCHVPSTITSSGGEFHIKAETGVARTMTAQVQAKWVTQGCKEATHNQTSRINCLGTDTCATMRSMWDEIAKIPEMAHVFTVPCDSHSLQLFIGDILERPFFDDTVQKAQSIVTAFRASHKELAILWDFQMKVGFYLFIYRYFQYS